MQTNKKLLSVGLIGCAVITAMALTSVPTQAATKTIKNLIVKSTDDSDHTIKAVKNGTTYTITVDTTTTKIYKSKSGHTTLKFSAIHDGDVLNIKGSVDHHDVTASEVRDLSTTKSATMYGVVIVGEINSTTQTVKIETTDRGKITVAILKSTKITYDGKKKKFADIHEKDKILVTGTWNSKKKTITKTKNFDILVKKDYSKLD
ncbi:MAG: hypothetical protein NT093_04640 [Candidatus Moranbacteria bacterium]|nr:hypothetical protein [Candidatus Moranbacteria bacterium]